MCGEVVRSRDEGGREREGSGTTGWKWRCQLRSGDSEVEEEDSSARGARRGGEGAGELKRGGEAVETEKIGLGIPDCSGGEAER